MAQDYHRILGGFAISLIALTPAYAQQPAPSAPAAPADSDPADPTINVIGRKVDEAQARREANDFVRRAGVANGDNPVARWVTPVCPKVLGIQDQYAALVEAKMRAIADKAAIALAPLPCKTNIIVSFTTDAKTVTQRIAAKSPRRLAEVPITARPKLLKGDAPIRWWYTTQVTGADGIESGGDGATASSDTGGSGGSAQSFGAPTIQAFSSSIIRTQVVRVIRSATVVIDVTLADGVPLDAVASYAAMVAFAELTANDNPMPNSILGLFGKQGAFDGPTDWDMTFLRTLYSIPHNRAGWKQRRMLVGKIVDSANGDSGNISDDPNEEPDSDIGDLTEGLADRPDGAPK